MEKSLIIIGKNNQKDLIWFLFRFFPLYTDTEFSPNYTQSNKWCDCLKFFKIFYFDFDKRQNHNENTKTNHHIFTIGWTTIEFCFDNNISEFGIENIQMLCLSSSSMLFSWWKEKTNILPMCSLWRILSKIFNKKSGNRYFCFSIVIVVYDAWCSKTIYSWSKVDYKLSIAFSH